MTDDAFAKTLEQMTAAGAAMQNGDPGPMINSWADSDDITLFGAWGPIEKGHKAVTDTMRSSLPAETSPTRSASSAPMSASTAGRRATW
jgi:hypothetical protein